MSRYPVDPNRLFSELRDVNAMVQRMLTEGWGVKMAVAENGERVTVTVTRADPCDPPAPAAED